MSRAARRVDQHLLICQELVHLAETSGASTALLTSLCLQLELSICLYLIEVQQPGGKSVVAPRWTLDRDYLVATARPTSNPDLKELADLAEDEDSWLNLLLGYFYRLRMVESSPSIKGAIFESDLESPASAPLIASSRQQSLPVIELAGLRNGLHKFKELVERQRLAREEF